MYMTYRRTLPILILVVLFLFTKFSYGKVIHDEQAWANINAFVELDEKWQGYMEYQPRFSNNRDYLGTTLYRFALDRKLGNGFNAALGYAFVEYSHPRTYHEDRPFLQGFHAFEAGSWRIINRTRAEMRMFRNTSEPSYRLRHMLRVQKEIMKNWHLVIWDEWFWNANSISGTARFSALKEDFDQNRAFVGLGYSFNQHLVEAGYMNQYINGAQIDRSHHVFLTQMSFRF